MLPKSFDTLNKILQYTAVAANALHDVAAATQIPFVDSFCTLSLTIIPCVQATKFQKERCLRMMEEVHQLLYALMSLCMHSDDIRSPRILDQIAQCSLTLQKFHACLRAHGELGTIKRLFKQNEIVAELDRCEAELKANLQIFTMESGVGITSALAEFTTDTERRHQDILALISLHSGSSDNASSIGRSSLNISSGSLSLLPVSPKIFYGRESELKDLTDNLLCNLARVAILGPGGMGKTTLAMAALHHPAIMEKYGLMHFISCESASTWGELVTNISFPLGLKPASNLLKTIVWHFEQCGSCLVVLDNFETPWEPLESRAQVEELLSLLADIPSLALLVTMRGAERPGKVKWNRPFLAPLEPLSPAASRQIFVEVADEPGSNEKSAFDDLLDLSGSLPLASVLLGTSLAYIDVKGRLKALTPIREYIRRAYPPSLSFSRPLRIYFQDLLEVWSSKRELASGNLGPDLVSHLGNINQLILQGLLMEAKSTLVEIGHNIVTLHFFSVTMLKGDNPLLRKVPRLIEETDDAALRWKYRCRILRNAYYHLIQDPDALIDEGVQYFNAGGAPVAEAVNFYNAVAYHYMLPRYRNISRAVEFNKWAFALAQQADDIHLQLVALQTEQQIAFRCFNPDWIIEVVHKARGVAARGN
ncbi:P-loop containing nucleoside triphosphate hydrolase protein [Mycena capillaripes]|nr:P-loop containing nucleoside triphosphate hydrolase protein [Mycena capillaripes]